MSKNDEMAKVEAALKRAGQIAVRGPRDARNGRFTATDATKKPPSGIGNNAAKKGK
jgi:hypothetical protein